jgi:hypothetical protein
MGAFETDTDIELANSCRHGEGRKKKPGKNQNEEERIK